MSNKPACRLGDVSTGHDGYPSRPNVEASTNVFINNKKSHRQGDLWNTHCRRSCHTGVLAKGSQTVFVNGKQKARIGDPISCGDRVATGSQNVIVGD